MKYVDVNRLRWGYVFVFGFAVLLMVGAIVDSQVADEAHMPWFISGLAALFLIAVLYYGSTQFILRDALSLTPMTTPAAVAPAAPPQPSPAPRALDVLGATGLAQRLTHERPPNSSQRAGPIRIDAAPAAPAVASTLAPAPTEPLARPAKVPEAPKGVLVQPFAFEAGDPNFHPAARGVPSKPRRGNVVAQARILCQGCSYYFLAYLEEARPAAISCPRCSLELGLSGARQTTDHVKVRCRHCGDLQWAPRIGRNVALQCATCGQSSE